MKDYNAALRYEIFEKQEYGLAKKVIQNAKLIFDVGGHVGFFSLWCFTINPQVKIHYFEPFPQLFQQAKENLVAYFDNLQFHNFGFGKTIGPQTFFFNPQKTMQSSQKSSLLNPNGKAQIIRCQNLNSYLTDSSLLEIDLIKMDIEGMEFEVLLNLFPHHRKKIKNLILEVHVFSEQDQKDREILYSILKNMFTSIIIQKSNYTERIFVCFACNTNAKA